MAQMAAQPTPLPGPAVAQASSSHNPSSPCISHSPHPRSNTNSNSQHPHRTPHRRFIGPLPKAALDSEQVREKRRWYRALRERLTREEMEQTEGGLVDRVGKRERIGDLGKQLQGKVGAVLHHQNDEDSVSSKKNRSEIEDEGPISPTKSFFQHIKPQSLGIQKNEWAGESFDIGASLLVQAEDDAVDGHDLNDERGRTRGKRKTKCERKFGGLILVDDSYLSSSSSSSSSSTSSSSSSSSSSPSSHSRSRRPPLNQASSRTTTASFTTARTHQPRSASFQTARTHQPSLPALPTRDSTTTTLTAGTGRETFFSAVSSLPDTTGQAIGQGDGTGEGNTFGIDEGEGSLRRLISSSPAEMADPFKREEDTGRTRAEGGHLDPGQEYLQSPTKGKGKGGLKSAMKRQPVLGSQSQIIPFPGLEPSSNSEQWNRRKGKTVQFPFPLPLSSEEARSQTNSGFRDRLRRRGSRSMGKRLQGMTEESEGEEIGPPVDPMEVLARTGEQVAGTSAGVMADATKGKSTSQSQVDQPDSVKGKEKKRDIQQGEREIGLDPFDHDSIDIHPGSVILRDRMLLRVGRNRETGLVGFDEAMLRRKPCSRLDRQEEYLVVYRKGRIELYQEWRIPLKERFVKTKRLCFTIPLSPRYTTFSLFSPIDLSFCLCLNSEPFLAELQGANGQGRAARIKEKLKDSKQLKWLQAGRGGTQIFIFNCREKRRAMDWAWEIWKDLDGQLPMTLEVSVPDLRSVVRLSRPLEDSTGSIATCRALSRSRILKDTVTALQKMPNFGELLYNAQRETGETFRLELAWRREGHLDWITREDELGPDGTRRDWALLAGLAIISPQHTAKLELRPARHSVSSMKLTDGTRLEEPPCVEGYLKRFGKKEGSKHSVYLHSYGGNLFSTQPRNVENPLALSDVRLTNSAADMQVFRTFMEDEHARGSRNILQSSGLVDFRDITKIHIDPAGKRKRAGSVLRRATQESAEIADDDKTDFEVVLESGERVRFEASNAKDAKEWVERLRKLHEYWKHRQRVDARERMDIARRNLEGQDKLMDDALDGDADPSMPLHWNWCPIENCSPVVHAGRLFVKKSLNSQFRAYYTVLSLGHLVTFELSTSSFHARRSRFSLLEAYVYSGGLAETEMATTLQEDPFRGEARIYQDGLECADVAEDCTFVIWLRKQESQALTDKNGFAGPRRMTNHDRHYTPPILGKSASRLIVLRARSKLERDKWVKVLQIEIQRLALLHPGRTLKARHDGMVPE